jgi:fibronectin-binding autotransporter adhesin
MNRHGKAGTSGGEINCKPNHGNARWRRIALATAAVGVAGPCGLALGQQTGTATIMTSNGAPTGAAIAQPDFSNSSLVNWEDYSNNAQGEGEPYPSGIGQAFFVAPNTTIDMTSFTIKGGGSAGGALNGIWTIEVGSISGTPGWGAGLTVMDEETADGTPIANDVANGITTNYDQFQLQNAQTLTGGASGAYYFFTLTTNTTSTENTSNYYALAKSSSADPTTGVSTMFSDITSPTSGTEQYPQSYDYTYFINGTLQTLANNNATWAPGGTGNWSSSAADNNNWVNSEPPATSASTATFDTDGGAITNSPTVDVVSGQEVSTLTFNNPNGYTLTGAVVNVTSLLTSLQGSNTMASVGIGAGTISVSPGSTLTITTLAHTQYDATPIEGGGTLNIGTISDPQGNLEVSGGTTVNITGSMPSGAFLYDINVATSADSVNLGTNNTYDNNSIDGLGTITIGAGSTLTTDEYNGYTFAGSLSGSGALILGSAGGASSSGAPYTGEFTGTSPNFSGPIDVTYVSTLQVGAGATLGNASSTNTITLDSGILQAAGNTTLAQNITIEDTLGISPIPNTTTIDTQTNTLTLTGNISGPNALMKIGTGTLVLGGANTYSGGTEVTAGDLVINAKNALPNNSVLSISAGAEVQLANNITLGTQSSNPPPTSSVNITSLSIASGGTLDIGNNHIIIDYGSGADPIASIETMIESGYDGGTWAGTGITSSDAAANAGSYGIGYADAADSGNPANLPAGEIEIAYTLLGDANLDGKVNGADFSIMATYFNQGGKVWDQGDFNYDGSVNGADFTLLAKNFNQSATQSAVGAADLAALDAFAAANGINLSGGTSPAVPVVPEPATLGLAVLAGVGALGRRNRRIK